MHVVSVHIGQRRSLDVGSRQIATGIIKDASNGPVMITAAGVAGDAVVNTKHHGGPDQAVYLYSAAEYQWWSEQLGTAIEPGRFGENITVASFASENLYIGDRLQMGEVLLEITAPRVPCSTLAARMGDSKFVKRFRDAERPGAYARVLASGEVRAGDTVTHVPGGSGVGLLELFRLYYQKDPPAALLRRALAAPLAIRLRKALEAQLPQD